MIREKGAKSAWFEEVKGANLASYHANLSRYHANLAPQQREHKNKKKEDDEASRVEDRSRLRGVTFTELLARRGMGLASAPKVATGPILASLALGHASDEGDPSCLTIARL